MEISVVAVKALVLVIYVVVVHLQLVLMNAVEVAVTEETEETEEMEEDHHASQIMGLLVGHVELEQLIVMVTVKVLTVLILPDVRQHLN